MAEQYKKPYLESSVFIAWIKGESITENDANGKVIGTEQRAEIAKHILSLAEAGQFHVYTAAITITEVHKDKPDAQPEQASKIIDFFRNKFFKLIDVDRSIAEESHRLCRKHRLKPYDAVHLACAVRAGCDVLLTWDSDLLNITHEGITVAKPQALGQTVLDLAVQQEQAPAITTTVIEGGESTDQNGETGKGADVQTDDTYEKTTDAKTPQVNP